MKRQTNKKNLSVGSLIIIVVIVGGFLNLAAKDAQKKDRFRTGVFLSLGHTNYNYRSFDNTQPSSPSGDPADLFLGISLIYKSHLELNLIYNRSTEGFGIDTQVPSYDKDGFGLEAGGVIPVHLFNKNNFAVSVEFVGGGYGILYLSKRVHSGVDIGDPMGNKEKNSLYQAGFYWGIRLRYLISGKASFEVGYKSMLPIKSNEFLFRTGKESLLFKSFFTLGVSF